MSISCKHFIIILIAFLFFCSKQEQKSAEHTTELTFQVDSTKLESAIHQTDLGITFNPPKGWTQISDQLLEEFSKRNPSAMQDSLFLVKPVSVFFNKDTKSFLYILKVLSSDDSTSIDYYKKLIEVHLSPAKTGDFTKDKIHFNQYLIQDKARVNFKLLFSNLNSEFIQFDYIIPIESYASELKAIESSIGSIQFIH